jgi:hypothetical protein
MRYAYWPAGSRLAAAGSEGGIADRRGRLAQCGMHCLVQRLCKQSRHIR